MANKWVRSPRVKNDNLRQPRLFSKRFLSFSDVERIIADGIQKERKAQSRPANLNFSAIHLLHDPQAFAEVLYSKHLQKSSSPLSITQKIVVLNLVSRLIAAHKLIVFGLYSWIIKYLPRNESEFTADT